MAHSFPANSGTSDFHTALIANDTFITDILVFTTMALVIPGRAKDGLAEQTILLRPQSPVIDGLWFQDLSV
jgi:hypothetical protein